MITGGFGIVIDTETGRARHWYIDRDGVKRWVVDDEPVEADRLVRQRRSLGKRWRSMQKSARSYGASVT